MRASAEMIFYADEIEELFEVLEKGYQSNGNIVNLGLICNFDLGLRGGELCALKWLDINWINETLFVQRQECTTGEVVDYVKSDSSAGYSELWARGPRFWAPSRWGTTAPSQPTRCS